MTGLTSLTLASLTLPLTDLENLVAVAEQALQKFESVFWGLHIRFY